MYRCPASSPPPLLSNDQAWSPCEDRQQRLNLARACYADSWFTGVNGGEAVHFESGKVIYPFGDVKTNTSRFATTELKAACGPNSGDWATFTTEVHLADGTYLDMMGVAHRRGPEIHTYLSTHGLTTLGRFV